MFNERPVGEAAAAALEAGGTTAGPSACELAAFFKRLMRTQSQLSITLLFRKFYFFSQIAPIPTPIAAFLKPSLYHALHCSCPVPVELLS